MPVERQRALVDRDEAHERWLADHEGRVKHANDARSGEQGRRSGTLQWRQMRDELGSTQAMSANPCPVKREP